MNISARQRQIMISLLAGNSSLQLLLAQPTFSDVTERTLQRDLSELVEKNLVSRQGEARAVTYSITNTARVYIELPEKELEAIFSDENRPMVPYDFERLIVLKKIPLFTPEENGYFVHYLSVLLGYQMI